jgi:hypothetical protein
MLLRHPTSLLLILTVALGFACKKEADIDGEAESAGDTGGVVLGDAVAEVTRVRGPKGLTSPQMEPGTFMGEGARIELGQTVEVPAGTQAELRIGDVVVRLNEQSTLVFDAPRRIKVEAGEIVVMAEAAEGDGEVDPFEVLAGDELLRVHEGEGIVRNEGERRHYAMVSGMAELRTGDATVELGPGASIDIPYEPPVGEDDPDPTPKPLVSLQPLEDAAWAASFDAAARMAATVPRGVGSLTARRAGSKAQRQNLRLVDQKVMVNISGRIAHTEIEQAFYNESGETMEGIYRFPLPADASISGLSLLVGNQWMDGEMVEKQRGKRIFQQIVDATVPRDPALLHWEQGNVFKLRIFPIPGRGERRIRLSYTQVLPAVGDALRYRYPMGGSGATEAPIDQFDFAVRIDGQDLDESQIDGIDTPMMRLQTSEHDGVVELASSNRDFLPTSDLGVDIPLSEEEARVHAETHLDRDGQAYFMLSFVPEIDVPVEPRPVHYAFVLDRSHSTTPELWTMARGIVGAMLDEMGPDDRYSVLACDTACDSSHEGMLAAGAGSEGEVEKFLDAQVMGGASDVGGMLATAAQRLRSASGGADADRVVVYLGDGVPSAGALAADELRNEVGRALDGARLQAVALGSRSDLLVLDSLVQGSGGDLLRADPGDDRDRLVRELALRARVPAARDVALELPEGTFDVHPKQLPAVRPGQPVTVVGKFDRPIDGDVILRARGPLGEVTERVPVHLVADRATAGTRHAHLPRTWAQEEVEHLTTTRGYAAKSELVALSQRYNVLSRYTALIVLENDRMYREFRVARRNGQTDAWTGKLAGKGKGEAGTGRAYQPAKAAEGEEQSAFPAAETEREAAADASASAVPAPSPAPEPDFDEDFGDRKDRYARAEAEDGDASESESYAFDDEAPAEESRPASRPRGSSTKPAPKKAKKKSSAKMDMLDPFDGDGGGGGGGYGGGGATGGAWEKRPYHRPRPVPRIRIRAASEPSGRTLDRIARLRSERDAAPDERSRHRRLVRSSIYAGHADALSFAMAWAEADPDHSDALLSLADLLAAQGDPAAMRAYASAVEVRPFSEKLHRRLATSYESKGDLQRACSHRRALVSIDPKTGSHHADLARCLHRAGRVDAARHALADARGRARSGKGVLQKVERELGMTPVPAFASLHSNPDLKAVLTWSGPADLDIAIVDKRGRRLSVMRPEKVRVREEAGRETLTLSRVDGAVHVEVTRVGGNAGDPPVHAELTIRTPDGARSFPVDVDHGTFRLAKVSWSRGY